MDELDRRLESHIPPPMKAPTHSLATVNALLELAASVNKQTAAATDSTASVRELVAELREAKRAPERTRMAETIFNAAVAAVVSASVFGGLWVMLAKGLVVIK
jgi:hypothetical protein